MDTKWLQGMLAALLASICLVFPVTANADGTLDRTFGDGGSAIFNPLPTAQESSQAVAVDSQGRIVVAGYSTPITGSAQAFVARFNSVGVPDSSFGAGGYLQLASSGSSVINDIKFDSEDRIVLAGDRNTGSTGFDQFLARILPTGVPDPAFSSDGLVTFDVSGAYDSLNAIDLDPAGRIVAAGESVVGGTSRMTVVRFNVDGTFDSTFDKPAYQPAIGGTSSRGEDVAVDDNGDIFVTGTRQGGGSRPVVAKLKSDGSFDSSYGSGGFTAIDISASPANIVHGLGLDREGRAVITVTSGGTAADDPYTGAVARFNLGGQIDPVFGIGGKIISPVGDFNFMTDLAIDPADRVVTTGGFYRTASIDLTLQRFSESGVDSTFADNGVLFDDFFLSGADGRAIVIDSEGRYVVTGRAIVGSDTRVLVARFDAGYPVVKPPPPPIPPPAPTVKCASSKATIIGTAGKDNLRGTKKRDVIAGLGGNDVIKGFGGNDLVCGGPGKDKLIGGPGKDTLRGERGKDRLFGGPGRDKLIGGIGKDRCLAGAGKGKLTGCELRR